MLEFIKLRPSVFLALLCALLLAHCGEASNNRCGESSSPQFECGSDAACVWAGDEASECLPKCESYHECAEGEFCYPRPVRTNNTELLSASVCFPSVFTELPQTEPERQELEEDCRARALEECGGNPLCQWEYAAKVHLDAKCTELMPVGCYALATVCTPSFYVAEDSTGELFVFAAGCGNEAYTGIYFTLDDPRFRLLFEGETSVYDWPRCN